MGKSQHRSAMEMVAMAVVGNFLFCNNEGERERVESERGTNEMRVKKWTIDSSSVSSLDAAGCFFGGGEVCSREMELRK